MSIANRGHDVLKRGELALHGRPFLVYEIVPSAGDSGTFRGLIDHLQHLLTCNVLVVVTPPLSVYGGAEGKDHPLVRMGLLDSVAARALAASLADAQVIEGTRSILGQIGLHDLSAGLIVAPKRDAQALRTALPGIRLAHVDVSPVLVPVAAFQRFSHLWSHPTADDRTPPGRASEAPRQQYMFEFGTTLGTVHAHGSLHGDVHTGNFLYTRANKVIPLDPATARFPLLGPSSQQCASDIATLLPELRSGEWQWFKSGYVDQRGIVGQCVVNLIETGREQKGVLLMRDDPASAISELLSEIQEEEAIGGPRHWSSYQNLAQCYSRLGRHGEADDAYRRASEYFDPHEDEEMKYLLSYNWGVALHRAGNYEAAAEKLAIVRAASANVTARLSFYRVALTHLWDSYKRIGAAGAAEAVARDLASSEDQDAR